MEFTNGVLVTCRLLLSGDTLDGDGGADLAATARIVNGWLMFRELFPFLTPRAAPLEMKDRVYTSCVRSNIINGRETSP